MVAQKEGQRMTLSTSDKISHVKAYMEPDLFSIVQKMAERDRETLSSWLRKLIIKELMQRGELSTDLLLRLAAG